MRKLSWVLGVVAGLLLGAPPEVRAEWTALSHGISDGNILFVVSDKKDPKIIFAGSDQRVYKSFDGGKTWAQIFLSASSAERIKSFTIQDKSFEVVLVCTEHKIYYSKDQGRKWDVLFGLPADGSKTIFCAAQDARESATYWVGTDRGLYKIKLDDQHIEKVSGLPDVAVYSLLVEPSPKVKKLILTSEGIYRDVSGTNAWEKVAGSHENEPEESSSTALQQFGVEELQSTMAAANMVFLPSSEKFYAATSRGPLQGTQDASQWDPLGSSSLPDRKINHIARSSKTFYVATDRGVFQWDASANRFKEIYLGLLSKEIHSLDYNEKGNYLLAATKKGVFSLQDPDIYLSPSGNKEFPSYDLRAISLRFASEPTILEVQQAAIRYAEVHPDKIASWRKAAARKAWAPTLSFHQDLQTDDNIDIDRGGTSDPDRFIRGPQEKSGGWYVNLSWNFGDLIWNNDQTSIDSRSKLMVELRNDILSEVTHLYYERRRLQVEMAAMPAQDLKLQIENQIRLEELTSGIDALTGGYLSMRLAQTVPASSSNRL